MTAILALAAMFQPGGAGGIAGELNVVRGFRGPDEMEQFVDGIMAGQRESLQTVGAVVVVVAGGEIYFSKGYGRADLERDRPVDPQTTLFRIGSVSKLLTATAVMQLFEQDKLALDRDVNEYLNAFKVPATFAEPVTPAHLLAHTAGFEDRVLGLFAHDPSNLRPLVITVAAELPARVRRPGNVSVYSNHGMALAGLIVQEISGMLWEDYVETNILNPLGMRHATVRQPPPPTLEPDLAIAYRHVDGRPQAAGFEFVPIAPAGSASAAGADMARFMIAHLQLGRFEDSRILSEATARLMQSRLFSNAPGIDGMLHGFCEMNQNGERIFGHTGGLTCFHTLLALMPEHDAGLFVAYNSDTGAKAYQDFWQAFLNHYFPAPQASIPRPTPASSPRLLAYAGEYSSLRRASSTLTKISALVSTVDVSVDSDGYLVTTGLRDKPRRWIEVEPSVFQEADGTRRIAFRVEATGPTTYLFADFPAATFVRHRWHESFQFHAAVAGGALSLLISALLFWPLLAWYMRNRPIVGSPPRTARLNAWLMSLLFAAFYVGLATVLADPLELAFGVPALLERLLWLPILAAMLVAVSGLFTLRAWARRYWSLAGRIHFSLVTLAGATLLWWTWHWNLLGFHY